MPEYTLDLPKEDIDAVLRTKRKAREPKACYPCHSRKVKCDRKLPCDSCIKRDHADLCTYERPLKRRQLAINAGAASGDDYSRPGSPTYGAPTSDSAEPGVTLVGNKISVSKEKWDKLCGDLQNAQEIIENLRAGVDDTSQIGDQGAEQSTEHPEDTDRGVHVATSRMGTVHLGSRSVVAYMAGLGRSKSAQDAAKTVLEENVLPKLGLDNETVTYPFVDLWGSETSANDISGLCSALPDDKTCRDCWSYYRDVACTIYPVVYDKIGFEAQMNMMLQNRRETGGAQSSADLLEKERELTSQVYVCCAYQALRMTNFMSYPTLESVQTLLVICNVLAYNMNPGNAYVVLGMTVRIAFSLGLQTDDPRFSAQELYARRRVWWALAWQDSHYSVSYDRPTGTALCQPEIPYGRTSFPGNRSYAESMFQIIGLTLKIIRARLFQPKSSLPLATILDYKDRVAKIVADAAPHLRDRNQCVKKNDHLERLALKLHANYITSELCRSVIKGPTSGRAPSASSPGGTPDADMLESLRRDFIRGLCRTIKAFLELHAISSTGVRSWIGIQRAVSSAFLLAMQDECRTDPHMHGLLRSLEEVISERYTAQTSLWGPSHGGDSPYNTSSSSGSGSRGGSFSGPPTTVAPQWAKSMANSLKALRKLNDVLADPRAQQAQPMRSSVPVMHPSSYSMAQDQNNPSASLAPQAAAAMFSDVRGGGLMAPVTPDSTGSSDWNPANLVERAGQYVGAPLW
ncbi:putative fungal specific transcription [Phaeomoniella chlamydospora]|uniref:Putative fungal specific transcription n=1 Tax=Phaeomoniella chlamydospora TaxID=158046 RepID=A0A0G2H4M7_PHACM|nr:putative fungal specific transcription [Phaeomoniella chlamydospora]